MPNIPRVATGGKVLSSAAKAGPGPRTVPDFANGQMWEVYGIVDRAGEDGESREAFLTPKALGGWGITQVGARIHELEALGFIFEHRKVDGEKFVRYVLKAKPLSMTGLVPAHRVAEVKPSPEPARSGWRAEGFLFGNPANSSTGRKAPTSAQSGLFESSAPSDFVERETGRKAGA